MNVIQSLLTLSIIASLLAPSARAGMNAGDKMAKYFPEIDPASMSLAEDAALRPVNYAQPPVGCVEEMVPHRSGRPCPDFSQVSRPTSEWPAMSAEDKAYWWKERRGIAVCRAEEVMRRERQSPGSQSAINVELSWMTMDALKNYETKVSTVYSAARENGIPLQVLTGAIYQESMFAELGVSDDGGNFSCGMQQINLIGWCDYMNKQPADVKASMNWPDAPVKCSYNAEELAANPNPVKVVELEFIRPLYQIAKSRSNVPGYRMRKEHYANIPLSSVVGKWPAADKATQELRYRVIMSYINSCSDPKHGIMAKANELKTVYDLHVGNTGFGPKDRYAAGEKFNRKCREEQVGDAYPLNTGWVLTIASYNGGPRAVDAVAAYEGWTLADLQNPAKMANYTPNDLVKAMYWGGKYNSSNDMIEFPWLKRPGTTRAWPFFKACVAQRHISRMMQHVTLTPDYFVDTLEGSSGCQRGSFPNGPSGTPRERQNSSGHR